MFIKATAFSLSLVDHVSVRSVDSVLPLCCNSQIVFRTLAFYLGHFSLILGMKSYNFSQEQPVSNYEVTFAVTLSVIEIPNPIM